MALKSTIFKATLQVNDLDRHYYGNHALTLARHPSETDERMMMRVLAFALHANEGLSFGRGLSADDEPDLWHRDLTGAIILWVDVGLPDVKSLRRAAGRARGVVVWAYGRGADIWWKDSSEALARIDSLRVLRVPGASSLALARLADRNMSLQCTIQDGTAWMSAEDASVELTPLELKRPVAERLR